MNCSKQQEAPINEQVRQVRKRLYEQPWDQSRFDQRGMLKSGHQALPVEHDEARAAYIARFTDFFAGSTLNGKRILVYQHSAVGRDLLVEILERLGAQVVKGGRSETFVPIDTENIDAAQLAVIQALADEATRERRPSPRSRLHRRRQRSPLGPGNRPRRTGLGCSSSAATW